ncbi:excitatory amino acid transporter 1 [Nilaparvata lugens]|uniref:excitatory amino acid transporter 1 n=1 Tax=Nilaparvata lugens TaxID=108931 RepID=UPI00193DF07E|nr:excitatory amino acid transporter 1 [Nilaparvata lugens]
MVIITPEEMATRKTDNFVKKNLLTILTVGGVIGGVIVGLILKNSASERWTGREVMYVQFVGDVFLRMLKGLMIPLVVSSIVSAIGSLDLSLSRLIGTRAVCWYLCTTLLAVVEGMLLVSLIQPGVGTQSVLESSASIGRNITTVDTLLDLVRNMFPSNIFEACIAQYRTVLVPPKNASLEGNIMNWDVSSETAKGSNILGLVVFASVLGIAIGQSGPSGAPVLRFFQSMGDIIMLMTNWVIWLSPVGIFFLVTSKIVEMSSITEVMGQLGLYFATVMIGLLFHGLILLPTFFFLFTRRLPFSFIGNMSQAIVTAFGTASSSATLPVSMHCVEEKNGVDPRVSRFILPIGATINMDGTALYEAVAALFIAQLRNVDLSLAHIIGVSITATLASIGAAGIPQAGLVTLVMVLDTVGLPAEDVTLVIAIDWILDRFRTTVNVLGDAIGAGVVNHVSKDELKLMSEVSMKMKTMNGESEPQIESNHL